MGMLMCAVYSFRSIRISLFVTTYFATHIQNNKNIHDNDNNKQ